MKNNKLIAEFMIGAWNLENLNMQCDNSYDLYSVSELSDVFAHIESDDLDAKHFFTPDEMKYHTSWDWLMPVVQKCKLDGQNLVLTDNWGEIGLALEECNLDETYRAVVEFIKEYNDGCHQTYNDERQ